MASCGADTEANSLIDSLTDGETFEIPKVDFTKPEFQLPYDPDSPLYNSVTPVTVDQLTSGQIGGTGVFDVLMNTYRDHLSNEQEKGRITGAEYTKAYIALVESAMNQSVAFLLGKDASFWQAQTAQIQAVTARVEMESSKVRLAAIQLEAQNQKANFALTKMKVATEEVSYCTAKYNLENTLPKQVALLDLQTVGQGIENSTATYNHEFIQPMQLATITIQRDGYEVQNRISQYNLEYILPGQQALTTSQRSGVEIQNSTGQYNLSTMLPQQFNNLKGQFDLIKEQMEVQRAQTSENRTDGSPILGTLGKQKALYSQQIISYERDTEVKVAKIFSDVFITMKTLDEGLVPPDVFTNDSINGVMTTLKQNSGLGS